MGPGRPYCVRNITDSGMADLPGCSGGKVRVRGEGSHPYSAIQKRQMAEECNSGPVAKNVLVCGNAPNPQGMRCIFVINLLTCIYKFAYIQKGYWQKNNKKVQYVRLFKQIRTKNTICVQYPRKQQDNHER